jgi:hypothetical protein
MVADRLRAETPNHLEHTFAWYFMAFWVFVTVLANCRISKIDFRNIR